MLLSDDLVADRQRKPGALAEEVSMAQPVPRPQTLDQGEDAGGDVLRNAVFKERAVIKSRRKSTSGGGGVLWTDM